MISLNALLPDTRVVLEELSQNPLLADFTFVGGSALACHMQHRLSEDLDFFSWKSALDKERILGIFKSHQFQILNLSENQIDVIYNNVKITFFANNWLTLGQLKSPLYGHIGIANLELLSAMKVNTLFMRARFRDYYDLYCLVKKVYTLDDLYKISEAHVPGITRRLFQIALTYTEDIIDDSIIHLNPKYGIDKRRIEDFFVDRIKDWNRRSGISK